MVTSQEIETARRRLGPRASAEEVRQAALSLEVLLENGKATKPYEIEILGKDFVVLPGVFSPSFFDSTPIFTSAIPVRGGDEFLEIGAGTGITSVFAALKGAGRVVAVDINPNAVENVRANTELHGVEQIVTALEGDVYSTIGKGERFDSIYWNLPFIYADDEFEFRSVLERSLFDPGYRKTAEFLSSAGRFLKPRGRVYAGFGNFGDQRRFDQIVVNECFEIQELTREKGVEGQEVEFILFQLTPKHL